MKIGRFDTTEKVLVVAEIGNNHEGRFEVAEQLVRRAAECGADAVKFQTYKTEKFVSARDAARFQRLKSFELTQPQFEKLAALAHSLNLLFISTPLDMDSAEFLAPIVDAFKVASGDNTFYPLIEKVVLTGKPVIVSAGLTDYGEILETVKFMGRCRKKGGVSGETAVLHCVSLYPTPPDQAGLRAIRFLTEKMDCAVGYSDHTTGLEAVVAAVALGARIVEKHFTLDKNFSDFRDHKISADPGELAELVRRVRTVSLMLGELEKKARPEERRMAPSVRRSIAASRDLPAGHRLTREDLMWIRPGEGLPPGQEKRLLGKKLKRTVRPGEFLSPIDVG
ncbi:MAG TPA: N-acetylneuraminate synthase family protein [Elusimicrobiota bacterium]|nr:N-acetylneuraminate synthase family protein [Elusimicrobiota bacterium]